jgi:hypothetical protein
MDNPWPAGPRFPVLAGTIAVVASALLGGSILAGSTSRPCRSAGQRATPGEITVRSARDTHGSQRQPSRTDAERMAATPGRPEHFRLPDEGAETRLEVRQVGEVGDLASVSGGATTSSPERPRADNELTGLCATQVAHPLGGAVR